MFTWYFVLFNWCSLTIQRFPICRNVCSYNTDIYVRSCRVNGRVGAFQPSTREVSHSHSCEQVIEFSVLFPEGKTLSVRSCSPRKAACCIPPQMIHPTFAPVLIHTCLLEGVWSGLSRQLIFQRNT